MVVRFQLEQPDPVLDKGPSIGGIGTMDGSNIGRSQRIGQHGDPDPFPDQSCKLLGTLLTGDEIGRGDFKVRLCRE
jgi:hypothetical protein